MHVRLKPNCSTSPEVLMVVLGSMAGLSIFIGLVFWVMGAPWILPFALIETLVLVVAFIYHARAVCDFDEIILNDRHLIVRQERKGQMHEHRFNRGFFRVSMSEGMQPRVRLIESGRYLELGEWLLPQERLSLCQQLAAVARSAL
jgi:uncharacterized membrane protein